MNQGMIGFIFGVVVGGLGVTLLIGLLLLDREPKKKIKDINRLGNGLHNASNAKVKMGRALYALWGNLR